ncbi:MAG: tetratricopeptide repeat protein [Victivallaceae bacterium]
MVNANKIFKLFFLALLPVIINGCSSTPEKTKWKPTQILKPQPKVEEKEKKPEIPPSPVALARAAVAANPMSWRAVNRLGVTLFKEKRFAEAALAFEQAIAMFSISSTLESEQMVREARQRAIKAQREANIRLKKQQAEAQRQMQEQQMLAGMLSMMPMMPGANAGTAIFAQAGQTLLNVAMTPSGVDIATDPAMQETVEASQALKSRELSAVYANLGQSRMALWEDEAALDAFRQAYAADPSRTDFLFIQGSLSQRNNDLVGAMGLYARYMSVSPEAKLPVAWIEIAECCRNLGLTGEMLNALAAARKAWDSVTGRVTTPTTEHGYSKVLETAGFYEEALPYIRKWYAEKPRDPACQRLWATALLKASKIEEAIKVIETFAKDPKSAAANKIFLIYFQGMTQIHLGNFDKAKTILKPLGSGKSPGLAAAANAICGRLNETKEWIYKIENGQSSPDKAAIEWYRLACVWLVNGNLPRAAECTGRSIGVQPEYGPALILREQLLDMISGTVKTAQLKAAQAVADNNMEAAVRILNDILINAPVGKLSESLISQGMKYVSALKLKPRMSKEAQRYYLRAKAVLKHAKGQETVKEALCLYLWALRYAPLNPEIHLSLSSVYETQKQYRKALYHMQVYLSGAGNSGNLDTAVEKYYELQYLNEKELRNIQSIIPKSN